MTRRRKVVPIYEVFDFLATKKFFFQMAITLLRKVLYACLGYKKTSPGPQEHVSGKNIFLDPYPGLPGTKTVTAEISAAF